MPKPEKTAKCGILLRYEPNGVKFNTYVEIKKKHEITKNAVVKIKSVEDKCINGTEHEFLWKSDPIDPDLDIVAGPKASRNYLKLTLTLTITDTKRPCRTVAPSPEEIAVTVTNDPGTAMEETSDSEVADPVFFP